MEGGGGVVGGGVVFFFFKQKTAYEIVSRDWSSDVCSSDLQFFHYYSNSYQWYNKFMQKEKTSEIDLTSFAKIQRMEMWLSSD